MTFYYSAMAILALVNLIAFLMVFHEKKLNYYILAMLAIVTISNAGNCLMAVSETMLEAYIAKKIYYIGGCFAPPMILIIIFKMCNINISKWIENILVLYSFVVFGMVLTIGYNDCYYANIELVQDGDATAVIIEYGILHNFFYVLLYGYLLIGIVVLFYSLINKNQVSRRNLWVLIGVELVSIAIFLVARIVNPDFEVMPLIFVIDGWIMLYFSRRVSMYNLEDNIISSLDKQAIYGYIMFDKQRNYLGASEVAVDIFPELTMCKIDRPVTNYESLKFIQQEIDEYDNTGDTLYELDKDGEHYEGNIKLIWYAEKAVGYLFEIENVTDRHKYTKLLAEYNENLQAEVEEKTAHIKEIQSKVLLGMANMVENRDGSTGGHIKRTSHVIEIFVDTIKEHNLLLQEEKFYQAIIKAAPMHDLGKIAIGDGILRKPDRLTDEEYAIMKTHAEKSGELVESILKDVEEEYFVNIAKNLARYHHEKWNGTGYPEGLKGEDIPLEARIMAVADVYDVLVSKRCYKEAMGFDEAYNIMVESMGSHFDPRLKEVFVKSREKLEEYYSSFKS